jgi:hypothetical protein
MRAIDNDQAWAFEQFSAAEFGDRRRRVRAVSMLRRALASPSGRLTEVFKENAELQGAYDFVQGVVSPAALVTSIAAATCSQLDDAQRTYVVVDGTSLSLTDRAQTKGFGSLGKRKLPTRGLKVIDALAVSEEGVPVGLLDLQWWARGAKSRLSRYDRRQRGLTETHHWVEAIDAAAQRIEIHAPSCSPCFVIDREGDNAEILRAVERHATSRYIVRAAQNRPIVRPNGKRRLLRAHLAAQRIVGTRVVDVPAGPGRSARRAVLDLRVARVTLDLPDRANRKRVTFETNVVWAVERRPPRTEKRLDWMLLTNESIDSREAADRVLDGYCLRWRVEDFHRTWKSGRCNVEETQLRSKEHVVRWATLLAAVATRVEQLKHLARTNPEAPASVAFKDVEIQALIAAKRHFRSRPDTIPDGMPTLAQAVRWVADLGGYTGKSSGGPPGSITIARGLEYLAPWTAGFEAGLQAQRK